MKSVDNGRPISANYSYGPIYVLVHEVCRKITSLGKDPACCNSKGLSVMILQFYLHKQAVAGEARQLGGLWACPPSSPRKFWISDLLRSFLAQSGSNHDRYYLGIRLNETAEPSSTDAVKD